MNFLDSLSRFLGEFGRILETQKQRRAQQRASCGTG